MPTARVSNLVLSLVASSCILGLIASLRTYKEGARVSPMQGAGVVFQGQRGHSACCHWVLFGAGG
jgi:hypothetical protein